MDTLTWKEYLKNYSSIKGLDKFVNEDSFFPYNTVENREALVVVHHHLLNVKRFPDFFSVYKNIEGVIEKNNPKNVFFSHANPEERPFNEEADRLPWFNEIDLTYIIGCVGNQCVHLQTRYLKDRGYNNLIQIQGLIKGECLKDSCYMILH